MVEFWTILRFYSISDGLENFAKGTLKLSITGGGQIMTGTGAQQWTTQEDDKGMKTYLRLDERLGLRDHKEDCNDAMSLQIFAVKRTEKANRQQNQWFAMSNIRLKHLQRREIANTRMYITCLPTCFVSQAA